MKKIFFAVFLFSSLIGYAQEPSNVNPKALNSIDGIVNELLRLISREKGEVRDMEEVRKLFLEGARFSVHTHDDSMEIPVESVTLDEFLELLQDPYYEEGFEEYEVHKVVDEYNGIAQVFQTYFGKDSEGYEERGITSYQLAKFNDRWWIVNLLWTGDGNGVEIPKKYLGK